MLDVCVHVWMSVHMCVLECVCMSVGVWHVYAHIRGGSGIPHSSLVVHTWHFPASWPPHLHPLLFLAASGLHIGS